MENYYKSNIEFIYDKLLLIDLLIHAQVIAFRENYRAQTNQLKGLYISDEEIDELLITTSSNAAWAFNKTEAGDSYTKLINAVNEFSGAVKQKTANTIEQGIKLNLIELAELFHLDTIEVDILSICLAPHLHTKYRIFFAYLQNDVTRKNPSVDLILNLLFDNFNDKIAARDYFLEHSPLFKNRFLEFIDDPVDKEKPLLARELKANNRTVGFILGSKKIDENLAHIARINTSAIKLNECVIFPELQERMNNFITFYQANEGKENFIFCFLCSGEIQALEIAAAVCNELGIMLIEVDLQALYYSESSFEYGIDLILRESKLIPAALYIHHMEFFFSRETENTFIKQYLIKELNNNSWLVFTESKSSLGIWGAFYRQNYIELELPMPDYEQRKKIWELAFTGEKNGEIGIRELAGKYNLGTGQIKGIVSTTRTFARWRNPGQVKIMPDDITEACRLHSNQQLLNIALHVQTKHRWDDIILDAKTIDKLKEIVKRVQYRYVVYNEWGFDRKLSLGKGVSTLFCGEPGTGKTLASEVIAAELKLDLYKIDISTVVSKYIGETEKNLAMIFDAAVKSNAILFFDEADALFGKRTEVKDSHDRYANIEVSYLLQKIDEFDGLVIMATNFSKNIDIAFGRRLHFIIQFPFPDEESRLRIWENIFPGEIPLDKKIDFKYLAKKLKISGGNIKNIALHSAFYAAESGNKLTMEHIMRASKMEFEKIGRLWDNKEFNII